jgi:tRNA(Ile)-lysidine synthase TilS/MesJ
VVYAAYRSAMRDSEKLKETVEEAKQERRHLRLYESGECELCGISDSHLNEGVCAFCRGKYNINDHHVDL